VGVFRGTFSIQIKKPNYIILISWIYFSFIFGVLKTKTLLLYQIALTLVPGVGDIGAKKLVAYCGSAEAVFKEKRKNLIKIPGLGETTANAIVSSSVLDRAAKEIDYTGKHNIKPLFFLDRDYPFRLKNCIDGPVLIYYKGSADLNSSRILGVVGTRRATIYGKDMCRDLIREITMPGLLVVSGLAYGIDTYAHKSALENQMPTVAVLAHGLDRIYPDQNRGLAEKMIRNGGLLTDFMSETNPDRENFPKRNRIIAGLCDALVVVETAKRGGAMITANIANSYNRDVFAFPGKTTDNWSEGCNFLIKTNKAALIQSAEDIRYIMQWEDKAMAKPGRQKQLFREFTPKEEIVMKILEVNKVVSFDYLVIESKLTASKIAAILLNLEFDGIVKNLPGKMFTRLS
jgi:DNA processing protein